jgi:hypothetical protein
LDDLGQLCIQMENEVNKEIYDIHLTPFID